MDKKYLTKFVSASILGDGYFFKVDQNNEKQNTSYLIKQTEAHKDYIEHIANVLEDVTSVNIMVAESYTDNRGYNIQGQLVLQTKRHPFFKTVYNRTYQHVGNTHIKRLDVHYLKLVDWESLAMLYMDDGWIDIVENKVKDNYIRCSIATHAFSQCESKVIRDFIAEKYNVHFDVKAHKQKSGNFKYYLCAKGRDNCLRFLEGIEPYVLESYKYKLKC